MSMQQNMRITPSNRETVNSSEAPAEGLVGGDDAYAPVLQRLYVLPRSGAVEIGCYCTFVVSE